MHAGIYYPTGSLKARLCVAGRVALYDYCAAHGVPVQKIGKLIVASDPAETLRLEAIQVQAAANGVELALLGGAAARAMEPALRVEAALYSPETGIVDSHALMLAYQATWKRRAAPSPSTRRCCPARCWTTASAWTSAESSRCSWSAGCW